MTAHTLAAGAAPRATGATRPRDFSILLPPGWVRLPLDGRAQQHITALATQQARHAPATHRDQLRTALVRLLTRAAGDARTAGGIDLLLSIGSVDGVPIPASCLVSHLEGTLPPGDELAGQLGGRGAEVSLHDLPAGTAGRVHRTRPADRGDAASPDVVEVTWLVPLPGGGGTLVFAFSTGIPELAPALVELFDAMAATVRWVA